MLARTRLDLAKRRSLQLATTTRYQYCMFYEADVINDVRPAGVLCSTVKDHVRKFDIRHAVVGLPYARDFYHQTVCAGIHGLFRWYESPTWGSVTLM